ncbi:MAG: pyruvate kinase [Candidatus Omnitrophica bacterium]|nr:pyruvate kinase [Candidatus Omnitrophota bacterium]
MVKTKIIATLGPSSDNRAVLREMITKGLDAVRLNFSHGTHADHIRRIRLVRELNRKMRRAVKIMQDLEGYRIRIGKLTKPIELKKRHEFYLTPGDRVGDDHEVSFDYEGPLRLLQKDSFIYIDDGKIILQVVKTERKRLRVRVIVPGILKEHKGMNIPDVKLDFEGVTAKDRRDVEVAIRYKLDVVAQSFVRNAGDVQELKKIIKPRFPECQIVAKIEAREALDHIEKIINESDGIMVARGDLGICVPIDRVPVIQKEIVKRCRLRNKPVIVATQMLDSMTEANLPTRAEVSDVANAVFDGATHLLLSQETAVGRHPAKVVGMMNRIIQSVEKYRKEHSL